MKKSLKRSDRSKERFARVTRVSSSAVYGWLIWLGPTGTTMVVQLEHWCNSLHTLPLTLVYFALQIEDEPILEEKPTLEWTMSPTSGWLGARNTFSAWM